MTDEMMEIRIGDKVLHVPRVDTDATSPVEIPQRMSQDDLFSQPAPFVPGSGTSHAAAQEIKPRRHNLRERVYQYIAGHPGCSDEDIADGLEMNPSTVRPRRVELARDGRILLNRRSTLTRAGRNAQAWRVATPDDQDF